MPKQGFYDMLPVECIIHYGMVTMRRTIGVSCSELTIHLEVKSCEMYVTPICWNCKVECKSKEHLVIFLRKSRQIFRKPRLHICF